MSPIDGEYHFGGGDGGHHFGGGDIGKMKTLNGGGIDGS